MEAPGKWQASPLPSRSGKQHEEMTSSSALGSCGPVCEVRYDKLPLMSCFPEVDPSPKWTQITPAGQQRPSSRNWENWAGTSVEWEGFPDSEASGCLIRQKVWEALTQLHSLSLGRAGGL